MRVLGSLPKRSIIPPSTSSSLYVRAFSLLTKPSSRLYHPATDLLSSHQVRQLSSTPSYKMSFSNTTVPGDKPADPYKATNLTDPDLKEKIEDLVSFMESCKFGMMTTRIASTGLLTSRCMALAAKVGPSCPALHNAYRPQKSRADRLPYYRKVVASIYCSTPTLNPAKPTTSSPSPRSTSPSSIPPASGPLFPAKPTLSLIVRWSANTTPLP